MRRAWLIGFAAGVTVAAASPLELQSQGVEPNPTQIRQALEGGWSATNLQPRGQPVIPIFEGWFRNPDQTYDLCFGFHNLNTEQVIEIPLGSSNFIDPPEFDGAQPTRFDPLPGPERQSPRRHWCVFTVTVPEDFGDQRVVWSLTSGGERALVAGQRRGPVYSTPGHLSSSYYELDEPDQRSPADMDGAGGLPRLSVAPRVSIEGLGDFMEARGRGGLHVDLEPLSVGEPLELTVRVYEETPTAWVWWNQHQGPGTISFEPAETRLPAAEGGVVTTTARLDTPGQYVIRMQAISSVGELEFQCCWTNVYFHVEVR